MHVWQQDPYRVCATGDEAACRLVRGVAQMLSSAQHPLMGWLANDSRAV